MARAVIRLGDYTSHGGRVIEATARMTIDGIPVALWGDHCSCPIDGHDNCVICEGEPNAVFDGRPVALEGHKTSCGASLMPSQHARCNVKPLVVNQVIRSSGNTYAQEGAPEDHLFDRVFQLTDFETGQSYANQRYRITTSQGVFEGTTNNDGITENAITGASSDDMKIELLGD